MRSPSTIPIAIAIAGVILAGAVYVVFKGDAPLVPITHANPVLVRPVEAGDHILGNPLAAVKIIVYYDFECPNCAIFHGTCANL